jgi:hypothetical protein
MPKIDNNKSYDGINNKDNENKEELNSCQKYRW